MKNLLVAWIVLLLYGCATYPQAIKPTPEKPSSGPEIYIVNHGWHTGIILAANDVYAFLSGNSGMKSAGAIKVFINRRR